jgi:hypothetical protein
MVRDNRRHRPGTEGPWPAAGLLTAAVYEVLPSALGQASLGDRRRLFHVKHGTSPERSARLTIDRWS